MIYYDIWDEYGYGIKDEKFSLGNNISIENLRIAMVKYLPEYTKQICEDYKVTIDELNDNIISNIENENGGNGGLTDIIHKLLNAVAFEKTGINDMFYSCKNCDDVGCLMVLPVCPQQVADAWENWKNVNTKTIDEIIFDVMDMIMISGAEMPVIYYQDLDNDD